MGDRDRKEGEQGIEIGKRESKRWKRERERETAE